MPDYEGLIRVGIQGLNQLKGLDQLINKAANAAGRLEASLDSIEKKQQRNRARITGATRELGASLNNVVTTDQGRNARGQILPGASPADRRAATQRLRRAELNSKIEDKNTAELERAKRLYSARLQRAANQLGALEEPFSIAERSFRQISRQIGQGSRGNYLANLFQGRQQEFTRGGAGAGLSPELQQQARNVRAAWDIATAGGRENLELMQRLSTEMSGLVRQQNELNRSGAGRSTAFEAGRRGQERITELSQMAGADPSRIRGLRSRATNVIATGNTGDIAGAREAQRRMNVAIGRYERELNRAASDLRNAPRSPIRGSAFTPGSPAFLEAQRRANPGFFQGSRRDTIGNAIIGGAFPLLFGQGVGASAGGLAGGALGGAIGDSFGFGLSLVGTAIGQAVDTTSNNLKELATSLKAPNDAIQALEKNGFNVSDSIKFQVQQLQSVGRAYDAQTLVLREVEKRLGPGAAKELGALNTEQKKLQESWSILAGDLQRLVIPGIIGFTVVLNDVVSLINSVRGAGGNGKPNSAPILDAVGGLFSLTPSGRKAKAAIASSSGRPALSAEDAFRDAGARIDESRKAADDIKSAYREAFNLQRQAHDLQRDGADLNREIADYSYKKEREIFDLRQQALEKQIENARGAAQNRIERSDLGARGAFASAVGFEQQLLSNVREVMRTRREGEADIEQSRRRLELTLVKLGRDAEDYKRTNAREIEDIERRKLAYVRSVEDYRKQVADYVYDRSIKAADYMRQAMTLPDMGAGGGAPAGAGYVGVSPLKRIPYLSEIDQAAKRANVDPRLLAGLVQQESGFNPNARSRSGAVGLAQLMPGTARELGVDPLNIQENLQGGAKYLRQMLDRFGLEGGLRAYNQGPGAQQRTPGGNSAESREYPGKVLANARALGFNPSAMAGSAVALTGATGIGSGAHLDVRWADGRPITSAEADKFIRVAGKLPSSFGVTSGYGPRSAPVPGASTFHRGIDFGTPAGLPITLAGGARLTGSMTEAQSGGGGVVGIIETPMGPMKLLHLERILGKAAPANLQASAAAQISNVPAPVFRNVPIGPTPSAAPVNAANMAARASQIGGEKEAQRIFEDGVKLREKGIELAQVEQVLQGNQLPQLELQSDVLRRQIELRKQDVTLSEEAAALADARAEGEARIAQLNKDRANALAQAGAQYGGKDLEDAVRIINERADLSVAIATAEEKQRLILVAQNEELRKQVEFGRQINQLQRETGLVGAGIRAGFVGGGARAFEQGLRDFDGDAAKATDLANRTNLLESQKLVWENLEKNIVDVSSAISGSLTNGLVDIVSGTKKIEDVGREMLKNIAGSFADAAQQQLTSLLQRQLAGVLSGVVGGGGGGGGGFVSSLLGAAAPSLIPGFSPSFAFGGFFANGGTTKPGEGYVIGEKGPEFFFPGMVGSVVPRNKIEKAAGLRGMKRSSNSVIDLRYTVTEQRGERYVTEEQFRKSNAALVQRARNSAYAGIRNSKDVRDYAGIPSV